MTSQAKQILESALNLDEPERAFLAERLWESLESEKDFPLSEEWRIEIARRCEQIDKGEAELIPAEEVFRKLREKLG